MDNLAQGIKGTTAASLDLSWYWQPEEFPKYFPSGVVNIPLVWIPQYWPNTNYCCGTAWNMEINFCPVCGKQLNKFNPFTGEEIERR